MNPINDGAAPGPEQADTGTGKRTAGIAAAVVLVLVAAALGYRYWTLEEPAPVIQTAPPPPVAAPAPKVNPAEGDLGLRKLAGSLSSARELAAWLAEGDILRRLVAATNLIADGKSPKAVVGWLAPAGEFEVQHRDKQLVAAPKSFARYDTVARVVSGIDVGAAATAYRQLQPYVGAAWGEIGPPNSTFDGVVHQSIAHLTAAPLPPADAQLVERGALFAYADPTLEALSGAQKQLLRMGPANAKAVQQWLRRFDAAVSSPAAPSPAMGTPPATAPAPAPASPQH